MNSVLNRLSLGMTGNLRILLFTIFLWELGFGLYFNNLLTIYMKGVGLTEAKVGTLLTVAGLFRIALMLPAGSIMDHVGRKSVILGAAAISIPGSFCYVFADGWLLLLIASICMSVNALGFPAMAAIIADSNAADPLDAFRKLYTVGPAVAFIIGPLAGGLIADVISQQAVFVTCAVVFSLALLLATRLTEPPLHNRGNRRGGYIDIVRHRPMRLVVVYGFAIVLVLSFGATFLPNLITDKYGFSDQQRGIAFSFGAVGTLFLSTAMAKTDRINHIRGVAIGVVSVGAMCLVALLISNVYVLSPAFILRGGFMMAWSLLTPLASDITPKHLQERSFASIEFATGVGNTIAPVLAGVTYELDQSLPFVIGAFLLPILGAVAIWLERNVVRPAVEARRRADRRESAALEPAPSPGPA
jgi:DHA1 family tetracycline resistance protein-like MFS transporter